MSPSCPPSPALAGEGAMRSMTDEGAGRMRHLNRRHPSRFARHLLPLSRERGE